MSLGKSKSEVAGKHERVTRASVTFPLDLYQALEAIAKAKKVSVAWVVRDATEKYIADQSSQIKKSAQEMTE